MEVTSTEIHSALLGNAENPREAIHSVKTEIEQHDAEDIQNIPAENSCKRYLTCALLAWQELGNNCVESLCRFAEKRKNEVNATTFSKAQKISIEKMDCRPPRDQKFSKAVIESRCNSAEMGPVIKLPVIESTIVMCMENCTTPHVQKQKNAPQIDVQAKVDQACCLESKCSEQLKALEVGNAELRQRAQLLAKREADRVNLIERAEAAWKDLEMGYQRRLAYAEDKELELEQQIKRAMAERNSNKSTSSDLQPSVTMKSEVAEKDLARLVQIDAQLCERARERHKLSEQCAKSDALVNEQACKAAQLDRDLQFQEDLARRKLMSLKSEVESADMLAFEANRAMTAELAALKEQINEVSEQLLQKDDDTKQLNVIVEDLRQQKNNLIEDLDKCKMKCDGLMQERVDELKSKTKVLRALKEEILECRCKAPADISVQVKRTPSLAALCKCSPEYKVMESCSCTSMRVRLMTDLLSDLFGGLQAELGKSVMEMPCQLLKCLENNHNWLKPSLVKTNLKDYFCRLLSGELDIAIATSIEKYHAKWTTPVCADVVSRMKPDADDNDEGWQERLIEQRAQKLATGLAEQLFNERADELTKQAKDLLSSGPPPCACTKRADASCDVTVIPCLVKNNQSSGKTRSKPTPVYWNQTIRDPTQQRLQEDDIKKPYSGINAERLEEKEKKLNKKIPNSLLGDRKGTNQTVGPHLIKNKATSNVNSQPAQSNKWHQTMQDVTALRMELENLKKDTIKKEDLEIIGDKMVAQIIHQASETAEYSKARPKNINKTVNDVTKIGKKINRAVSQTDMLSVDNNQLTTAMNKDFDVILPSKNISKSINQRTNKPFSKKINPMYAVNVCLCTNQQRRKIPNVKSKSVASAWKKKRSKDVSQILNENQTKPMSRLLPKYINELTCEEDTNKCPSKCACFKKAPSNSSLDKLWETLTKLKSDLQGSCNMTDTQCIEQNKQYIESINLISNASIQSSIISPNCSQKDSLRDIFNQKGNIYVESWKNSNGTENSQYAGVQSNEPIGMTESEYMGAVNLDKSNEDPYKRVIVSDIGKNTHLKSVTEHKCPCKHNKMYELNKQSNSEVKPSIKRSKQAIVVENMKNDKINVAHNKKDTKIQDPERDIIEYKQIQNPQYSRNIKKKQRSVTSDSYDRNDHNIRFQDNERNSKTVNNYEKNCSGNVCPYQVKLLGVTLADIYLQKNKRECDDDYHKHNVNRTQYQPSIKSAKNGVFNIYDDDTSVTRYTKFLNGIPDESSHFYSSKGIQISSTDPEVRCCPVFDRTSAPKQDKVESSLTQILPLNYVKKTDINEANTSVVPKQNYVLYSSDNMTSTQIKVCKNYESGKCRAQRKIKKSTSETSKVNSNLPEDVKPPSKNNNDIKKKSVDESTSYKADNAQPDKPKLISCQCSAQLNEFKKIIEGTLHNQVINKDEALDVPSFNNVNETEESCVCHIQSNTAESKDLEENTFHLLEDYLKQKLDELKSTSCSSECIPREEEDKLLCTILLRVKKLITDSTNQVTCNCMNQPLTNNAQGSWNRAYGLLQEYLKTKIKKVQCPCILTEDNNDTILPSVLSKVSHLIEYDFQRLKEVCGCKDGFHSQEPNILMKEMGLNTEMAQKQIFQMPNEIVEDDKQVKTIYNHHNVSPQESIGTGMDEKSFKDVLLETDPVCDCDDQNISPNKYLKSRLTKQRVTVVKKYESLNTKNNPKYRTVAKKNQKESFNIHSNEKRFKNCTAKNNIGKFNNRFVENVAVTDNKDKPMGSLQLNLRSQHTTNEFSVTSKRKKQLQSKVKVSTEIKRDIFVNSVHDTNTKTQNNDFISSGTSGEKVKTQLENSTSTIFLTAPYIGCTLECSNPNSLELDNVATDLITTIWNKSVPDEAYFKKVSYNIMNSQPKENDDCLNTDIIEKKESIQEVYTQECQAETNEQIVLKKSVESINKTHTMTNTFDENTSIDTDYSANEETLDWCECCPHFNPIKGPDTEKIETKDIDINVKTDRHHSHDSFQSSVSKSKYKLCECDMVPICHVKMLVENIENNLINSKCTCDLLIPKLCPKHSPKCENVDKVIIV